MEEKKNLPPVNVGGNNPNNQNNQNTQNGNGGGRKRRRKKHNRGGGGQNQKAQNGQNVQNGQSDNAQRPQNNKNQNNHNQNKNKNQGGQKGQNQSQNQSQNQNGKQPQNVQNAQNGQSAVQNKQNKQNKQNQSGQSGGNNQNGKQNQDENRKDTYAYVLDGNLYINLTNKCSNGCDFCVRNERASYYGNYLWLRHGEPTAEKVIAQVNTLGDLKQFKEVVFCGFGEPTYKTTEMLALCEYFHEKGLSTRLNTNGQGNLINKRDIVPELKGKIDLVNVSLNASSSEKYQKICRSQYGTNGFDAMIEFAKLCKRNDVNCRFSIVDCIGEDEVEACKKLCEQVRIPLYIRKYIADS